MQAVVTDDLNPYKPVFEQLGVGHKSLPVLDTGCASHTSESGCGIDSERKKGGTGTRLGYGDC